MKKKWWYLKLLLCLLILCVIVRIVQITKKHLPSNQETILMKEHILSNDIEITVIDASLKDIDENFSPKILEEVGTTPGKAKAIIITLQAHNTADEYRKLISYDFILSSGSWSNGVNPVMFYELNENAFELETMLNPNETITLQLGYTIYDSQISSSKWNSLSLDDFELVYSIYPIKSQLLLSE